MSPGEYPLFRMSWRGISEVTNTPGHPLRAAQRDVFVFLRAVLETFFVDLTAVGLGVAGFGLSVSVNALRRMDAFFGLGLNVLLIFFDFCFAIGTLLLPFPALSPLAPRQAVCRDMPPHTPPCRRSLSRRPPVAAANAAPIHSKSSDGSREPAHPPPHHTRPIEWPAPTRWIRHRTAGTPFAVHFSGVVS
jgi:hypothetical protein